MNTAREVAGEAHQGLHATWLGVGACVSIRPAVTPSPCPSEENVARFLAGGLQGDELTTLERHLATCPDCLLLVEKAGRESGGALATTQFAGLDASIPPVAPETHVGRYIVRSSVGAGAMGRVYAAYDPTLDREIALKVLHPSAGNASLEARLLREAKAMARLAHHPEVVPVYDAGRHGTQLFIAMEFVEGGTLRGWLAAEPRPWREIIAVFQRAGRGLAHAHAAGLVHRDFKPDNVLVGRDGRVRVTDFGLARILRDAADAAPASSRITHRAGSGGTLDASLTRTGTLLGTPAYMAPEQLDGGDADARSDIFSFCVALYEALYGERPFKGSTVAELRDVTATGVIALPRAARGVPRGLSRVLQIGLRPRPEDRHASMTSLLEAIDRATRDWTSAFRSAGLVGAVLLVAAVAFIVAFPAFRGARGGDSSAARSAIAPVALTSGSATVTSSPAPIAPPTLADAPPAPPAPSTIALAAVAPAAGSSLVGPVAARARPAPRASVAPAVVDASAPATKPDCNPNYYFDRNGKKHFKADCFE